ncbi:MAG: nucleoside deaminase [Paramuribaculum sp.]|nr:nucleoside deaminase [Paramuribaculum sp.]
MSTTQSSLYPDNTSVSVTTADHEKWMRKALDEARKAAEQGEVPIGAVVVHRGRIIGRGHNLTETLNDVTAHAEMMAITAAANTLGGKYLTGCTLYVTVEPCPMCAGAIGWSQIPTVVYGASDAKRGYSTILLPGCTPFHPKAQVITGILADEASTLMKEFFRKKRQ